MAKDLLKTFLVSSNLPRTNRKDPNKFMAGLTLSIEVLFVEGCPLVKAFHCV